MCVRWQMESDRSGVVSGVIVCASGVRKSAIGVIRSGGVKRSASGVRDSAKFAIMSDCVGKKMGKA